MNGHYSKPGYALRKLSWVLTLALGLSGSLLLSQAAMAEPFYKQLAKEESAEETSPKQASEEEDEEEDDEEK